MHPLHRLKALVICTIFAFVVWSVMSFRTGRQPASAPVPVAQHVSRKNETCFLAISDIHLHSSKTQDDITATGAPDTGYDLWDTTQNKIKHLLAGQDGFAPPKFIIVLGDLPWHVSDLSTDDLESAHNNSGQVLHDLRTLAENAHIPLIYVPGNNDSWDGGYHPFSTKIFGEDAQGKTWPLIHPKPDDAQVGEASIIDTSRLGLGYYSCYPLGQKSKLRVIALNTTIFSHKYTDKKEQDAQGSEEMQWFANQLEQVEANKEFVLIAMHVPMGLDGFKKKNFWKKMPMIDGIDLQNSFLSLIAAYKNNVIGLLSSHTHMDGIRRLYTESDKIVAVDISVPGIAPGHGNNPGIKMISYNPVDFSLQNFTTLYEPFYPAKKVVSWGHDEFDFKTEFGCPTGTSIRDCLDTLNQQTLQNGVQSIHNVKNGRGKADEVNPAINVEYETLLK